MGKEESMRQKNMHYKLWILIGFAIIAGLLLSPYPKVQAGPPNGTSVGWVYDSPPNFTVTWGPQQPSLASVRARGADTNGNGISWEYMVGYPPTPWVSFDPFGYWPSQPLAVLSNQHREIGVQGKVNFWVDGSQIPAGERSATGLLITSEAYGVGTVIRAANYLQTTVTADYLRIEDLACGFPEGSFGRVSLCWTPPSTSALIDVLVVRNRTEAITLENWQSSEILARLPTTATSFEDINGYLGNSIASYRIIGISEGQVVLLSNCQSVRCPPYNLNLIGTPKIGSSPLASDSKRNGIWKLYSSLDPYLGQPVSNGTMFFFDCNSQQWTTYVPTDGVSPPRGFFLGMPMVYDQARDEIFLFTESNAGSLWQYPANPGTWIYTPTTNRWTDLNPSVTPSQNGHLAYDPYRERVMLLTSPESGPSELWAFNRSANLWYDLMATNCPTLPVNTNGLDGWPYYGFAWDSRGDCGYFYSGTDLWRYDPLVNGWEIISPSNPSREPPDRLGCALRYSQQTNKLYLASKKLFLFDPEIGD